MVFSVQQSVNKDSEVTQVKIAHDFQKQILEIPSLIRVINNYYHNKSDVQAKLKPLALKKFKEGLKTIENDKDWLYTLPTALSVLSEDLLHKKDAFRFPDSIILFEAWMNLGFGALYPRLALHYKFPGLLKGEKIRHVFQFTFSTSRGFGFPIYFGPEFYGYILTIGKILEPLFKWSHTICHRANQAIFLVGKRYGIKRHHPGEFESVIISEYENNMFKGTNTLLHGYFTQDPKKLGVYSNLEETLENIVFSYSIGDHAMNIEKEMQKPTINIPLMTHEYIVKNYNVNFNKYLKSLIAIKNLLIKKILRYKKQKKEYINNMKRIERIKFRIGQSKTFSIPRLKLSKRYSKIQEYSLHIKLMERLIEMLWTSPLYSHTIHYAINEETDLQKTSENRFVTNFDNKSIGSIFLLYVTHFEETNGFTFKELEVLNELEKIRDIMGTMWLYFKEKHFNFALKKLSTLSTLSLDNYDYKKIVNEYIDNLIPIFSIYEIFNRSLSESVYPESIPQTKRLGAYIARFLTSRFNPFGVNLMNLFNKLAFYNWSYFILRRKLNRTRFFNTLFKLPIWKHIPHNVVKKILDTEL
ncbi:MAG: hypothetical protein HWN80_10860 [Candidatus Lokiarchaeota archaeon]|nr:hypothetical protein [Candidatus Lokiarchaeota archaeon]